MKNTQQIVSTKIPFYKKWWFLLIVAMLIISPFVPKNEEEIVPAQETETTKNNETEAVNKEEKLVFELVAGVQGEYGRMITYNKGTEFEENFYAYYIPVGTYIVTNIGEKLTQLNVYSDEIVINDAGWEEIAESFFNEVVQVGQSKTITIEEGRHIEISEPTHLKFEQQ